MQQDSVLMSAARGRYSVVIAMVIGLIAQVCKTDIAPETIQQVADNFADLIVVAGMAWGGIVSLWSKYRAKKAEAIAKEPPSLINNCG